MEIVVGEPAENIIVLEKSLNKTPLLDEKIKDEIEKLKNLIKKDKDGLKDCIKEMDNQLKDELICYLIKNV
jgi:glutaredoxin 2